MRRLNSAGGGFTIQECLLSTAPVYPCYTDSDSETEEAWGVTAGKESLAEVLCFVPLVEGQKNIICWEYLKQSVLSGGEKKTNIYSTQET